MDQQSASTKTIHQRAQRERNSDKRRLQRAIQKEQRRILQKRPSHQALHQRKKPCNERGEVMGKRVLQYRRKQQGKTDYKKRLALLKSGLPRLVIRGSNKNMQVQLVEYQEDGDKVLATTRASDLKKQGWNKSTGNLPAAYLTGLLLAKKSKRQVRCHR